MQISSSSQAQSGLSPNEKLDLCCRKRAVNPACQSMCNFDVLNEKTVDHSQCCEKFGLVTFQGGRCLAFCRAHTAQPTNPFEFLPCLQVFELIKTCYRQYQSTHKNIFGD
ncbi:DB module [Ostertagia ostertagi]